MDLNYQVPNKRRKTSPSLSGLCSLPDEVAVSILAQVSRFDRAALAIVSKRHRPLVASPELCNLRRPETSLYVCLQILPDPSPRWFVLTPYHRLRPIPSNPYQPPESSSFVAVDGGIYVFGGLVNGTRTSDVSFLDCFTHTWRPAPSMMMPRASASAHLLDGKVYLMGGCREDADETNWAEVFNLKTQTWHNLLLPTMCIHRSVAVERQNMVYVVDVDHRPAYVSPGQSTTMLWTSLAGLDSMPGEDRTDWCLINNLFCCRESSSSGRILWCVPGRFDWTEVKGLEELRRFFSPRRLPFLSPLHRCRGLYSPPTRIHYDLCKLITTNSADNIVLFWNGHLEGSETSVELWCTEVSLERRQGYEIWGKVEWSHPVLKLDPLSPLNSLKINQTESV